MNVGVALLTDLFIRT